MKLYVEGGGDTTLLRAACREGFKTFLEYAGVDHLPRIVACGSRQNAYESFCVAIKSNEAAILLVDSEAPIAVEHQTGLDRRKWRPWRHLKDRAGDGWDKPKGSEDKNCHMMVQCMEAWFLADHQALAAFFGQGFNLKPLPSTDDIESIAKAQIFKSLSSASKTCKTKLPYAKGDHSFKLLARINPKRVAEASPWTRRFIERMRSADAVQS